MDSIGTWVVWVGATSLIVWVFILSWPYRKARHFTVQASIAAPTVQIWKAFFEHSADGDATALHTSIVSAKQIQQDPPTYEYLVDATGGYGTHHRTIQVQVLHTREGEYQEVRTIQLDGKALPYGPAHIETVSLRPNASGTTVTTTWRGETATLGEFMMLRRANKAYLRKAKEFYDTGRIPPKKPASSLRLSLALSSLAIITFILWLGWLAGLFLSAALILHEFGHWIAMKLTGQPAPRIMLVPFLGGAALANHPHKTLFRDAFCALMGPGVSALASLGFVFVAWTIGAQLNAEYAVDPTSVTPERVAPMEWFFTLGLIIGVLNLVQMIPLLPLDGGQVLRAVMQSFHAIWARRAMLGLSCLGVIGFAISGDPLLAGVVAVGGLQAWHLSGESSRVGPMSARDVAVVLIGYTLVLSIHGAAAYIGAMWLRFIH
jgi:Zn-dependent protease